MGRDGRAGHEAWASAGGWAALASGQQARSLAGSRPRETSSWSSDPSGSSERTRRCTSFVTSAWATRRHGHVLSSTSWPLLPWLRSPARDGLLGGHFCWVLSLRGREHSGDPDLVGDISSLVCRTNGGNLLSMVCGEAVERPSSPVPLPRWLGQRRSSQCWGARWSDPGNKGWDTPWLLALRNGTSWGRRSRVVGTPPAHAGLPVRAEGGALPQEGQGGSKHGLGAVPARRTEACRPETQVRLLSACSWARGRHRRLTLELAGGHRKPASDDCVSRSVILGLCTELMVARIQSGDPRVPPRRLYWTQAWAQPPEHPALPTTQLRQQASGLGCWGESEAPPAPTPQEPGPDAKPSGAQPWGRASGRRADRGCACPGPP